MVKEVELIINAAIDIKIKHSNKCRCRLCLAVKAYEKSQTIIKRQSKCKKRKKCESCKDYLLSA